MGMEMDLKEFGVYLSKLREKSGYKSQRQLALAADVAPATLSRIEGGTQKASPETLEKLAKHLKDVSYEDLMNASGYLNKEPVKRDENVAFHEFENLTEEEKEYLELQLNFFREKLKKKDK
jgi:HTH-type transcriptional regulator, competence development regulator